MASRPLFTEYVQTRIATIQKKLEKKQLALDSALLNISKEKKKLKAARRKLSHAKSAQAILQEVAESVQNTAHKRIRSLVSKCLSLVFEEPYEFKIEFVKRRNKTEANLYLVRNGNRLTPDDSTGGGVIDVAAFSLRLAALCMRVPKKRRVLILDEPFKNLSAGYRPKVRRMIELLSEQLGVQFIITTHMKSLRTGTIVEV